MMLTDAAPLGKYRLSQFRTLAIQTEVITGA